MLPPINLNKWIEENKSLLQPPVGAKLLYTDIDSTFVVMIVGGPNQRTDYHVNETDEFFYQFQGDMVLKIVNKNGEFQDIKIREGETFMLPGNTPHSPQRYRDTIGLVIEKKRGPENTDKLLWYCDNLNCRKLLFQRSFKVDDLDLGKQLTPIINEFYGNEELRTCKHCNHISQKPKVNDYI